MHAKTMRHMVLKTIGLAALGTALFLSAAPVPVRGAGKPTTRLELAGIAGGMAVLEYEASPLVTMRPVPFRLTLTNMAGMPIAGAEVRCDLTMPAMAMPENRPTVRETEPGVYRGEALFTMAGAWQAAFSVELPEGGKEILLFAIDRVLLK